MCAFFCGFCVFGCGAGLRVVRGVVLGVLAGSCVRGFAASCPVVVLLCAVFRCILCVLFGGVGVVSAPWSAVCPLSVLLGVFVLVRSSVVRGVRGAGRAELLLPGFSWCPVVVVSPVRRCVRRVGWVPVAGSVLFVPSGVPSRCVGGCVFLGFASSPLVSRGRVRSGLVAGLGLAVLSWLAAFRAGRLGALLAAPGGLPVLGAGAFWWRRFVCAGLLSAAVRGCVARRRAAASGSGSAAAPVAASGSGSSGAWVPVFRPAGSGARSGVAAPVVPVAPSAVSAAASALHPACSSSLLFWFIITHLTVNFNE